MPEVSLKDGGSLFYEIHGEGEPVLFLNGIMMATRSWVDYLPVLSPHLRLIFVDFRDQGRSSRLAEGYDLRRHAADLVELLDALALPRVHVMGLSYGGEVALLFALENLQRLKTLILANVPPRTSSHLTAIGKAWEVAAELEDGERFFQLAIPFIYSAHFYEREAESLASRQELFGKVLTREWFEGLVRLSRAAADFEITPEELRRVDVPVLLLGADEDLISPVRDMEVFREHLPRSELLILHRAGHGAFLEQIPEFTTALLGFVLKHRAR